MDFIISPVMPLCWLYFTLCVSLCLSEILLSIIYNTDTVFYQGSVGKTANTEIVSSVSSLHCLIHSGFGSHRYK